MLALWRISYNGKTSPLSGSQNNRRSPRGAMDLPVSRPSTKHLWKGWQELSNHLRQVLHKAIRRWRRSHPVPHGNLAEWWNGWGVKLKSVNSGKSSPFHTLFYLFGRYYIGIQDANEVSSLMVFCNDAKRTREGLLPHPLHLLHQYHHQCHMLWSKDADENLPFGCVWK